ETKRRHCEQEMTEAGSSSSADGQELGAPLSPEFVRSEFAAAVQFLDQGALQCANGRFWVAMGTAERRGEDTIDDSETVKLGRRDLHRFRRLGSLVGGSPPDRRADFG